MARILRKYTNPYPDSAKEAVEVLEVEDEKYIDGIKFSFVYFEMIDGEYREILKIDNSHGKPHVHKNGRKTECDFNWKQALDVFENMVQERREYKNKM